jgi:hypothetical protein
MTYDDLRAASLRAWLLTLAAEYEAVRTQAAPALDGLTWPSFEISERLERTLGHWDAGRRCIGFSMRLIREGSWDDIVATLKHEIAHQVVHELFGETGAAEHGPAFTEACRRLGIPATATRRLSDSAAGGPPILRRIEKLLALGQSANRHEAERALAKAQELMLKHNVSEPPAERPGYSLCIVGPAYRRTPSHIWWITRILADFYFVQFISRVHREADGRSCSVLELYGRSDNLPMAEYVFYFLLHEGDRCWRRYAAGCRPSRGSGPRLSFLKGLYDGVWRTLRVQRRMLADELALVWHGDPQLEHFFRERNPRVVSRKRRSTVHADAHAAGRAAGEKLRIHAGLRAPRERPGGLLPG